MSEKSSQPGIRKILESGIEVHIFRSDEVDLSKFYDALDCSMKEMKEREAKNRIPPPPWYKPRYGSERRKIRDTDRRLMEEYNEWLRESARKAHESYIPILV